MAVNGGMLAGAASLALLIVPLVFFTAGRHAVRPWTIVTISVLAVLFYLDLQGLLPENNYPPVAQQVDRVLTLIIGMLVITTLIFVFDNQINNALATLDRERANYRQAALYDDLTGLPNRRFFYQKGHELLNRPVEHNGKLMLLFIDINLFKQINDQYGHAAGDAVLAEIARRLRHCADDGYIVARLSGDEFAVMIDHIDDKEWLKDQQKKIRQIAAEPVIWDGLELKTSLSIGSAYYPDDGLDFDTLLSIADKRMYWEKSGRRDQARPELHAEPVPEQKQSS